VRISPARRSLAAAAEYETRSGVLNFLCESSRPRGGNACNEMEQRGNFLLKHIDAIAIYSDHPVRFGAVESINTTNKVVLRRARGMRDEAMLLLRSKWATAHARSVRSRFSVLPDRSTAELKSVKTVKYP
jgi:hypothetical protein